MSKLPSIDVGWLPRLIQAAAGQLAVIPKAFAAERRQVVLLETEQGPAARASAGRSLYQRYGKPLEADP